MRVTRLLRVSMLMPVFVLAFAVCGLTAEQITYEKIIIDGSTGVMPVVSTLAEAYEERQPANTVEMGKGLGTRARIQALAEGKIDIALASHGLVLEDLTRQGMMVQEIAKVAVVIGVNAGVTVTNLTDRQVCEIYAGRVTNWQELGGPDLAIIPSTRPDTEVDAEVVRAKLGCMKELQMAKTVKVMPKTADMAQEIAATKGAMGMTTLTVVEQSGGRIKALPLNGVAPDVENVKRNTYTLTRDMFLVTKASPASAVTRFLEFIRSPAGEAIIIANGAVPVR